MNDLEFGLGGHLEWDDRRPLAERLERLREDAARYDPEATVDFLEMRPASEADAETAARMGMPFRQFTWLYVVGGDAENPDARDVLRDNLDFAARCGTVERLNMQVVGDNHAPSLDALVRFYRDAWEMADAKGIRLFTETHVDRFTYDPRRLLAVHEALLAATNGARGLDVCADFSHYVHQLDNPTAPHWADIRDGRLRMDPFDPENLPTRGIVERMPILYGHLRMAVPNPFGRGEGSIQYPVVDPNDDPDLPQEITLARYGPWREERTRPWKAFYRRIFAEQLRHPERPTARFATEFIDYDGDYRSDPYPNRFQNLAMLSWAHRQKRELAASLAQPTPDSRIPTPEP